MGVQGNRLARPDSGFKHAHEFVFERASVMQWRSNYGVEKVWLLRTRHVGVCTGVRPFGYSRAIARLQSKLPRRRMLG